MDIGGCWCCDQQLHVAKWWTFGTWSLGIWTLLATLERKDVPSRVTFFTGKMRCLNTADLPKSTTELVDLSRKPTDIMFYPNRKPPLAHLKNPEWKAGFLASFLDVRFPKREVGQKCSFSQGFKSRAKIAAMAAMTWFLFWLYFRTLEKVFDFLLDNGATEEMIQSFDLVTCVWVCLQWQSPVSYHRMPCFPSHKNSTRIWRNPIFPAALLNLNGDLGLGSTWKSFIFQ